MRSFYRTSIDLLRPLRWKTRSIPDPRRLFVQERQFLIKVEKSAAQKISMSRILARFKLLQKSLPRETQIFAFADTGCGFGRQLYSRLFALLARLRLLRLYRLAFPAARHSEIIG